MKKPKWKSENSTKQMKIETKAFQNMWEKTKIILNEQFIEIQVYLKKQMKKISSNQTYHVKEVEK